MNELLIGDEKRKSMRVYFETNAWLVSELDDSRILAQTENLSRSGITILSDKEICETETYHIMFFLPDDNCIMCEGSIEWVQETEEGWKAGLQFEKIPYRFSHMLEEFLDQCA